LAEATLIAEIVGIQLDGGLIGGAGLVEPFQVKQRFRELGPPFEVDGSMPSSRSRHAFASSHLPGLTRMSAWLSNSAGSLLVNCGAG